MSSTENMSKAQLQERLKAKGDAISGRFESIESKIPGKLPTLMSAVKGGAKSKVGLAVGAGLLIGLIVFRRKSSPKPIQYSDGLDRLSNQLASRIADLLSKGSSSQEAIRKALEEQPPLMNLSPESESLLSSALKQVLQASVSMFGSQVADYLRNRKKEDTSS